MVSPWPGHGVSAKAFTINAAIWLIVSQWMSAALGGYLAGRLRTKWVGTHTHEVFFRDTAHGLVTWSVATVVIAAALAGSVSSLVGGGLHAMAGRRAQPPQAPWATAARRGHAGRHDARRRAVGGDDLRHRQAVSPRDPERCELVWRRDLISGSAAPSRGANSAVPIRGWT